MKIGIIFLFLINAAALGMPDASEWTKPRNFHVAFEQEFQRNIEVAGEEKEGPPETAKFSENEVYWFNVEPYDEKGSLQRILLSGEGDVAITLKDTYSNFPIKVRWINEKLVFIRVWWGRIEGTDMIFDVEKQEFLSREMIYDGTQLYNQTQQALGKADPGGGINSVPLRSSP